MLLRGKRRPARRRPSRDRRGDSRPRARSRRPRGAAKGGRTRSLVASLEQRHFDLIGLGLVAAGVYLACILYGGWEGGPVGEWLKGALAAVAGRIAYVVPLALAGWGVALVMRPFISAPGALNAGGILLLASLLLAFAAETIGLGPSHPVRHGYFDHHFYEVHGGAVGEGLYWAATTLFQRVGAQVLAVLMFVSGLLLITGTTVSGLLARAGRAARTAGAGTRELAKTVRLSGLEGADPRGDEQAVADDVTARRAPRQRGRGGHEEEQREADGCGHAVEIRSTHREARAIDAQGVERQAEFDVQREIGELLLAGGGHFHRLRALYYPR